jgi:hypothetical protein
MKSYIKITAILMLSSAFSFPACGGGGDNGVEDSVISIAAITGISVPVIGATPVAVITETQEYTGTVTWDGDWTGSQTYAGSKAYTATITLTEKSGYTLLGVAANFFTVGGVTSVSNLASSGVITALFPATATISIGDAVLGGKVAFIIQSGEFGYVAGEQHGLIAATADQSPDVIWALVEYQSTPVSGTQTGYGSGSANTDKIIAQNGAGNTYAAGLARSYNGGGYHDWYLPSQAELNRLYLNRTEIGGFAGGTYWSSSERNGFNAWYQDFNSGGQSYDFGKNHIYKVRGVRSF